MPMIWIFTLGTQGWQFLNSWKKRDAITGYISPVTDVVMEGNTLKGVVVSGKEGRQVFNAKVFADATGDGDVAYYAGGEYMKGREEDARKGTQFDDIVAKNITPRQLDVKELQFLLIRMGVKLFL